MHSKTWGYSQRCENGHPYADATHAKYFNSLFSISKSQSDNGGGRFVGEVMFFTFPFDTSRNVEGGYYTVILPP